MRKPMLQIWKLAFTDTRVRILAAVTILWGAVMVFIGSDYPFHYDSINYALGIADDFDIGKCQPHAWGYLYHIFTSRIWLPLIGNPFRIQQVQNVLYFLIALIIMVPRGSSVAILLLIPATLPLTLFLVATGMIHGVSFAASAVIAWLILKLEKKEISPVLLAVVFSISIGFRQDLAIFMGPVVFVACIRYRCSFRQWIIMLVSGVALTAVWYVGTSWSSGWLSPWKEANYMVKIFLQETSLLYGAPYMESLRIILRFLLYIPAVFGPGGLLVIFYSMKKIEKIDALYLSVAIAPFFIYGILFYLGLPNYYTTIMGFIFCWILLRRRLVLRKSVLLSAVAANILFFLLIPAPLTQGYGTFQTRSVAQSVLKQLSYIGATGRAVVVNNRGFEKFLDRTVRECDWFSSVGSVEFEGLPYHRIMQLLANRVWHNNYSADEECADCQIRVIGNGELPDKKYGNIGVWYRTGTD